MLPPPPLKLLGGGGGWPPSPVPSLPTPMVYIYLNICYDSGRVWPSFKLTSNNMVSIAYHLSKHTIIFSFIAKPQNNEFRHAYFVSIILNKTAKNNEKKVFRTGYFKK